MFPASVNEKSAGVPGARSRTYRIYLDQYANSRLQEDIPEESVPIHATIVFRVDEKRFHEITEAVMEESGSEKWKNGGPYKKLTDGWREIYDEETEASKPV